MRHRHLQLGPDEWTVETISSVLERGGATEIVGLLRHLHANPTGPVASAARKAAAHSDVYGYPSVIRLCLDRWSKAR